MARIKRAISAWANTGLFSMQAFRRPMPETLLAPAIQTCYVSTIDFSSDFFVAAIAAAKRPTWTSKSLKCRCSEPNGNCNDQSGGSVRLSSSRIKAASKTQGERHAGSEERLGIRRRLG
jgi:hypothetical protein